MTVWFGGTPYATAYSKLTGLPTAGLIFPPYTDQALTIRATGLVDEDGSQSDSALPAAQGRIPGSTTTSKVGGMLTFGAPDGTTVLYYDRGDGKSAAIYPRFVDLGIPANVVTAATDAYGGTTLTANGVPL